jgi:hypothetical protein
MLNSMLLLIELEVKRYKKQQTAAWSVDSVFSPRGQEEFEESFKDIHIRQFRITTTEMTNDWMCFVKRIDNNGLERQVLIPKEPIRGSYFGKCNCGVDLRDAVPCEHMAVVAASSRVPNVTRYNICPYWWTREHWRIQIPQVPLAVQKITMNIIKTAHQDNPDHNLHYCPDWTAAEKSGRPKKNKRKKSILERATGKKGQKKASGVTRARRYCQSCGAHNHVTQDCWSLTTNAHKRPKYYVETHDELSVGNNDDEEVHSVGGEMVEEGVTGTAD